MSLYQEKNTKRTAVLHKGDQKFAAW